MPPIYSKVSVPRALFARIDALVEAHPEWGYRSASEVLTDLGRRWAEEKEAADARASEGTDFNLARAMVDRANEERHHREGRGGGTPD